MKISLALSLPLVVATFACAAETSEPSPSSSSSSKKTPASSTSSSTEPNEPAPTTTEKSTTGCVSKDAKANEKGVGAYCDKTTKCTTGLCAADFDDSGFATFCTKLCSADTDCGTGAYCYHDPRGSACVMAACKPQ